jgi:hypothetical protein
MWKREIPATPAIWSRVSSSARWLSINQSAFWAGFIDHGLHSKPAHYDRLPRAAFDNPCSRFAVSRNWNRTNGAAFSPSSWESAATASLATSGKRPPLSAKFHRLHVQVFDALVFLMLN